MSTISSAEYRQRMAVVRETGNKKVKGATKVDEAGVPIADFKAWRTANPDALAFDSKLEWHMWAALTKMGIPFVLKPTEEICPGWRHPDGTWMRPITIAYDFAFPWAAGEIVDTKGHPTADFTLRHRLFQWYRQAQGKLPVIRLLKDRSQVNAYLYSLQERWRALK